MDNGPAKRNKISQVLQTAGDLMGDPFEISNIRREVNWVLLFRFYSSIF